MPKYRVAFFKSLLSSDGHPFKCLQEQIVLSDMETSTQAAECASKLFAAHHGSLEWRFYADEVQVTLANNGS
jgi:hypothetical protein